MKCTQCGMETSNAGKTCQNCGAVLAGQESDLKIMADGTHQWVYEMSLWKNPTILATVWKVVLLGGLAPALLMFLLTLEKGFSPAALLFLKVYGLMAGIFTALLLLAYPALALLYRGKYCVIFEMDEKGVRHTQLQKQFEKARVLSMLAALGGAAAGSPAADGAGLLAGTKQSTYTRFSKVKNILIRKKRQVIYLNENLGRNQIYADGAAFKIVEDYILEHCKKARVTYK